MKVLSRLSCCLVLANVSLFGIACGSSGSHGSSGAEAGSGGASAGTGSVNAGSGSAGGSGIGEGETTGPDSGDPGCGLGMNAPAKGDGFQVCSTGVTIKPNQDIEFCEVVTLPGTPDDTYYVNELQTRMTAFSHHLIIMAADPGSSNEANMPDGKRVNCVGGEQAFGGGLVHVAGSQHQNEDTKYPDGVGKVYHGGQRLSFDYHYFNSSDKETPARAALNMYTVDKADVEHIAYQLGFYNYTINTAPGATGSFDMACTAPADIMIQGLTRHTHRWGTDFTIWAVGGPDDGKQLWQSNNWELETEYAIPDGPIVLKKGQGYKFRCSYNNTTDHTLRFGTTTQDEMCILFGSWWKINESDNVPTTGTNVGSTSIVNRFAQQCGFPQ